MLQRAAKATTDLLQDATGAAQKSWAADALELQGAHALLRKAQWRLDFVAAENSMGFHAPQELRREYWGETIDLAREGQLTADRAAGRSEQRPALLPRPRRSCEGNSDVGVEIESVGTIQPAPGAPSRLGPWSYRSVFAFGASLSAGTKESDRGSEVTCASG